MKKFWLFAVAAAGALAACDAPTDIAGPGRGPRFHHEQGGVSVDLTAPNAVMAPGNVTAAATLVSGTGPLRYTWSFRRCDLEDQYACSPDWTQIADGTDVKSVSQYVAAGDWWVEFLVEVKNGHGQIVAWDIHTVSGPRGLVPEVVPPVVVIAGLESLTTAGYVTAGATLASGTGSWRYTWYYRSCTDAVASACAPTWTPIADGQDVTSVTQYVSASDWWAEFMVQVKDVYGEVLSHDVHRVTGPRVEVTVSPLDVSIFGPDYVTAPAQPQYDAYASGGDGTYTYAWEQNVAGEGWQPVGYGAGTVRLCVQPRSGTRYPWIDEPVYPAYPISSADQIPIDYQSSVYWIELRVTVTSAGQSVVSSKTIQVSNPLYPSAMMACLDEAVLMEAQ